MWIYVKTIGHTAAASVYKMRQALVEEQAKRRQLDAADKSITPTK